jgi:hypothetical protein
LQYNTGGSLGAVGPLTNGQVVIGATGGAPQAATLTAGAGVSITYGPGSVIIAANGGGTSGWTVVTSNTVAVPGGMYLADTSGGSFNITLPTSGVVEIRDAKGTFGTNNLILQAASGQTLSGITYSGVSSVALNAPGNNAIILCGASAANVQQVDSGVWGQVAANNVSSINWTNLPPNMDFDGEIQNLSATSSSFSPAFQIGTGSGPTWLTSNYSWQSLGFTGGSGTNDSYIRVANGTGIPSPNVTINFTVAGNAAGTGALIFGSKNYYAGNFVGCYNSNGAFTAFRLIGISSTTFSAIVTLRWKKINT